MHAMYQAWLLTALIWSVWKWDRIRELMRFRGSKFLAKN